MPNQSEVKVIVAKRRVIKKRPRKQERKIESEKEGKKRKSESEIGRE